MLFNSIHFALFFPIVFALYWFFFSKSKKYQNIILLISSYYFYAQWDYRFLFLLIASTLIDYFSGVFIYNATNENKSKLLFYLSIGLNLTILFFFKYFNFFIGSLQKVLKTSGLEFNTWTLKIIIPVGISFYTFHGLSYVTDVYKKRIKSENNFVVYSLFVSYFPLLVAGPIERATHLLPQLKIKREFNYSKAISGLRQVLWGLFKKIVIADSLSIYVNEIFQNYEIHTSSTLILGAVLFAFQIYGDFSGYSDIALGVSRMFGIELLKNFNFPYFSRDIAEFWRRWHISLSSWFRDYLYIPLGGSSGNQWRKIRNTFIIFVVSGFWHGANWTFIVWGALNAVYFLPLLLFKKNRKNIEIVAKGNSLPSLKEFTSMILTFSLTVFAWIFFRSVNISQALSYIRRIFTDTLFSLPPYFLDSKFLLDLSLLIFFIVVEWFGRENDFALKIINPNIPKVIRYLFFYMLVYFILFYSGNEQKFIYFNF